MSVKPTSTLIVNLQKQLTLSHLIVTLLPIGTLLFGLWIGSALYKQSDAVARPTGEEAQIFAEDFSEWAADQGAGFSPETYISSRYYPVDMDDRDYPPEEQYWLILSQLDGTIIGSNYPDRYPAASNILDKLPPLLSTADWETVQATDTETVIYYHENSISVGLAPVYDSDTDVLNGVVYLYIGDDSDVWMINETLRPVVWTAAGVGGAMLLFSVLMGWWLARYFGGRIHAVQKATAAFADGNFYKRVELDGDGEIARLGHQFNRMADTIAQQMGDLRQLADDNAQLAEEADELGRLEERTRLARDLHDAVKQQLFGLNLMLGSLPPLITTQPEKATKRVNDMIKESQAAQLELENVIHQLRPAALHDKGLSNAIRSLATTWMKQTGVPVILESRAKRPLPLKTEQAAYRIVQEALQNIGKHANATRVAIKLVYEVDQLELTVNDNGRGFDSAVPRRHNAHGIGNMANRVTQLGGMFTVDSQFGQGTTVVATFPINELGV